MKMRSRFALAIPLALFYAAGAVAAQQSQQSKQTARPNQPENICRVEEEFTGRFPPATSEARTRMEAQLAGARANFERDPDDPEAAIWLGRRTAYLGRYCEAIAIYSEAIEKHARYAKLFRHRGHRYISLRQFDLAIRDLERAARLVAGKPDEIEPDGQPNARNTPTSTTNSNIWYHLGLAYYLKGDFRNALRAYRECMKFSRNPDMQVATSHWLYMTLRRLGRTREARKALEAVTEPMDIVENHDYHKLLMMYQGKLAPEALAENAQKAGSGLGVATTLYGIGNWFLNKGDKAKARELFQIILGGSQWTSFGYIAAEADMKRIARGHKSSSP